MRSILYAVSVEQWMFCLIWTFFYISDKRLRYFFSFFLFFNHLNEQTPCNHRRKLALSEYKAIKQNRLSELERAAWRIAGHIWRYSSLTAWSRFAAWSDTVWRLLFTVEKLTKVFLLKRWEIFLPLEDLSVPGFAAHVAVSDLTLVTKREPPAFGCFLYLFVLNVPPQCNIALLIPLCFSSAHHHQLPVVVTPWCCFPSQHQYNLICK